eukprot:2134322-Rhodomonas_salina.1
MLWGSFKYKVGEEEKKNSGRALRGIGAAGLGRGREREADAVGDPEPDWPAGQALHPGPPPQGRAPVSLLLPSPPSRLYTL